MNNDLLQAALSYAARGFAVFPLSPKNKVPILGSHGCKDATTDQNQINEWWSTNPDANIGIATGMQSGLAVIDLDTKEAVEFAKSKEFPHTPLAKTGKGYHAYYRYKKGLRNFQSRADLPGIDLRAEGGYVLAPPSVHPTGKRYEWVMGRGLDDLPIAEGPWDELFPKDPAGGGYEQKPLKDLYKGARAGTRNTSLARLAGSWVNDGLSFEECMEQAEVWNVSNKPPLSRLEIEQTIKNIMATDARNHRIEAEEQDAWPEPLQFGEIDTPEISTDLLPGWLGDFCKALSDATQTPPGLSVMFALSTVAGCLQKRFVVCPYGDDYTEPVNIWTVTALDPGNRKTAVKNAFCTIITEWEQEQAEQLGPMIRENKHRRDINQKAIDQLKARAAKSETTGDREELLREIVKIENDTPDEKIPPRLWTDDVTPERLQALLSDQGERIALLSDEGGIFEVMAGLYSNGRANLNVFLQGHAGAPVRVDRQGRSVMLHKPALTFGLTVQPDVICDLARGSKVRFRGNGTLARFLFCIPRSTIGKRDLTKRITIPEKVKADYHAGIRSLLKIEPVYDERGNERARILLLSPDALQAWLAFSQYIESKQGPNGEFYSFQDWTSKLPGAALRISGLFHVVEHGAGNPTISQKTVEQALDLCELLISHARAAFGLMGDDPAIHDAKVIFKWLMAKKNLHFRQSDIYKELRSFNDAERVTRAMRVLTARHITSEPIKRGASGRPSIIYEVNPAIFGDLSPA